MIENIVKRALNSLTSKSVIRNAPETFASDGLNLMDSFFSYWLGTGAGFSKFTKAYCQKDSFFKCINQKSNV